MADGIFRAGKGDLKVVHRIFFYKFYTLESVIDQMLSPKIINIQLLNNENIGPEQGSKIIF